MKNEPQLFGFLSLIIVSIAFFNFAGVSITKYMSATTRKVLDTLRTLIIWLASMLLSYADDNWSMPSFKVIISVCQAFHPLTIDSNK